MNNWCKGRYVNISVFSSSTLLFCVKAVQLLTKNHQHIYKQVSIYKIKFSLPENDSPMDFEFL